MQASNVREWFDCRRSSTAINPKRGQIKCTRTLMKLFPLESSLQLANNLPINALNCTQYSKRETNILVLSEDIGVKVTRAQKVDLKNVCLSIWMQR